MKYSEHLIPSMFGILGMLEEFISRFNRRPNDRVERFYPHESSCADAFRRLIQEHERATSSQFTVSEERTDQGHIHFVSKQLAAIIDSYYRRQPDSDALAPEIVTIASPDSLLAFVNSAYQRYSYFGENVLLMANAGHKLELIGHALADLGCRKVGIYVPTEEKLVPTPFLLSFEPPSAVADALGIQKVVRCDESSIVAEVGCEFEMLQEITQPTHG